LRKPRGFRRWTVRVGDLLVSTRPDGSWIILACEPEVKIDNRHRDGRPHLHVGGWDSEDRRPLQLDLTLSEAARAVARQLEEKGSIDARTLEEELS
jgi:hypothetical protein